MRSSLTRAALVCTVWFVMSCQHQTIDTSTRDPRCTSNTNLVIRAPLRRLTRIQYTNVMHSLFPQSQLPEFSLPDETIARGFENNADLQNPSAVLVEAYFNAARDAVDAAFAEPQNILPCLAADGDALECGRELVRVFGRRIFRRPLSSDEMGRYDGLFALGSTMPDGIRTGAKIVLESMLQAPQFIYVPEFGTSRSANDRDVPLTSHELATRLALFLWDDLPDEELAHAADTNTLVQGNTIEVQARRMLDDPRARQMVRSFHRQWLDLERLEKASKDPATFPEWNDELRKSMNEEALSFVEDTIFEGQGTLDELLTSNETRINAALATIYDVSPPANAWESISLDPAERAGILTLPAILAAHGHPVEPSPVLRGVFILERFLCAPPPAPPPGVETNVAPMNDDSMPMTNRARYEAHVTNATCASCHLTIDGAGFPFEQYDSIGKYRTLDNGFPVDTSGELYTGDSAGAVENAVALAHRLAKSGDVRHCMTRQWFRYAFGRIEETADVCYLDALNHQFEVTGNQITELILAVVTSRAFSHRPGKN